tara:strand:+ start:1134 stop:1937 length:804 start_codon:yes stop_codon:yes gene_type:complete
MGGGGSQTINQTFNMDVVNENLFKSITTNQQSLSASMKNIQKIKVKVDGMGPECDIKIGQTIDATSQSSATMSPQTITAAKDSVQNDLSASASAAMAKVTEAGNMQFGDEQDMNQTVNMAVTNVIDKVFETNNLTEVISEMIALQEGDLEVRNCNGKIDFSQNIVATLMAEAITKSLTSAISENETLSALSASTSGDQSSENKGIADIVDSIGAIFSGPMMYGIIASVVCCCLLIVLLVVMGLSPAGQKATGNLSAAGAARMGGRKF